jgi:hypothetical protein
MNVETASVRRGTGHRLAQRMAFATGIVATLAMGQVRPASANPQYPLAIKTRWTYEMRQEFGPGVHASEQDAALVKGNVLETTLVTEVMGSDMIGGAKYSRVESRHDGRVWLTEWMRLTPEGLFLAKTNENGNETIMTPPQQLLAPAMAAGKSWSWKASDAPVSIRTVVVGKDPADVPAGKFDTTKIVHELTMVLPEAAVRSSNSRWFSPGVGYIRQESEVYAGERLLTRTRLRLLAFDAQPTAQ